MRGIDGEQVLLRIIVSESRTHDRVPVFRRLLELLRAEGLAGATVLKGTAGFGHDRDIHTLAIEVVAQGLPIVLEVVDTPEHIESVLPRIHALMSGGVVMTERARVIRYGPSPPPPPPPSSLDSADPR
jgi:PII-like signaling protein